MAKDRKIRNLDDLAKLAGYSKATVSRAMANSQLLSEKTRTEVQDLARKHGFQVNRNARKLIGRTNTIAVALDFAALDGRRISDPFHFELLADVAKALAVRDQELLLCSPKIDEERGYEDLISARAADGIIFLGQGSREAYLRKLSRTNVPFVVWGAVLDGAEYCSVGTDNLRGGKLVAARIAELGRKRVVYLGAEGHLELDLRRAGLQAGFEDIGYAATISDVLASDLTYEHSFDALERWFSNPAHVCDAIFAASDTKALAAISVLRNRGLSVPQDVTVIGYDDIPFASYLSPTLTTVRQDTSQGGALLVEKLMQRLDGGRPTSGLLPTRLVVRES